MIALTVRVEGLDRLRGAFQRAPQNTLKYLALATRAAVFEIDKQVDEGGIMQFRTPRSQRTGFLVATWGEKKRFDRGGLRGTTGPTMHYAPYVYFGTRRSAPNRYIDRIVAAATPGVEKHFNTAVDKIVNNLAK